MSLNCHFPFLYCSHIRNALSLKTVKRYPAVSGASFPQQEAEGYGGSGMPERVRRKRYARKRYAGKRCARTGMPESGRAAAGKRAGSIGRPQERDGMREWRY